MMSTQATHQHPPAPGPAPAVGLPRVSAAQEIGGVLFAICAGWLATRYWLYPALGVPDNAPLILRPILGFLAAWWLLRRNGKRWFDFGLRRPARWLTIIAAAPALYALCWVAVNYVLPPLAALLGARAAPTFLLYIRGHPVAFIGWIAIAWVVGAFIEELLFRGFLLNRIAGLFASRAAGLAVGIVGQALLFGALHWYQGSFGAVSAGTFALIFGVGYLACGRNLWPLVVVHGIWNSVSIASIYGL